ncbi:MAG TPA: family 78 glycoside hydrolase catalytic domain [Bacteroidota bacterium]|nr:family 78 glycoside hydrolase catalytic domain [Bacteroidota bacterium]
MNIRTLAIGACLLSLSFSTADLSSALYAAEPSWIAPFEGPNSIGRRPCPIFRSSFRLDGQVESASVEVIGLGHYELFLNGERVGKSLVNQPWSQYNRTIYTQEFDISNLLRAGENAWGVMLGNSYWRIEMPADSMRYVKTDAMPDFSGGHPYLLWLKARLKMKDGSEKIISSDASWKWTDGPLTSSNFYGGEDFDARLIQPGWNAPGFDDSKWTFAKVVPPPAGAIEPYLAPPITAHEIFQPLRFISPRPGEYTYVFPQNCSALIRFTVEGAPGKTVRFKPCEYMDSTGQVKFTYTWGTGKDIWHDYTLRGSGPESHQILFCYVGCLYVGITGAVPLGQPNPTGLPVIKSLELVHVRADCPIVGTFSSSSDMQNRADALIDWSIRSNMSYVATDCPHREKNGYQEQVWHMARAISYRYDVERWFEKIARDVRDTQLPDGHIPTNCPNFMVGYSPHGYWNEAPEWGISGVLLPWHLYEWYGSKKDLEASYESMKKYVDYLATQAKDGIINSNLGDWYDYGHGKGDGPSQWTPTTLTATAVWALGASTVRRAAIVLGKPADEMKYGRLADQIKSDFQRRFYDPTRKSVLNHGSCQAANSVALCAGLIPGEDRSAVLQAIVDDLERRDYQQTVGEVMQVFLIRALAEGGRNDVLHRIYSRENRGSYGFMVRQGLTSLPESWDARPGTGSSMNHFMLGHLLEWHFAYVAGIRQQPGDIGWKRVLIAPEPGPLDSASAAFESPSGRIIVSWMKKGTEFKLKTMIPSGIQAEAVLPNGERHILSQGENALETTLK